MTKVVLKKKFLVSVSVLDMFEKSSRSSTVVSQVIYGHLVYLLEEKEGWSLIETEDNYRGFVETSGLVVDDLLWRFDKNFCRISSLVALVRKEKDIRQKPFMSLAFNSRVKLLKNLKDYDDWVEIALLNGETGWVKKDNVEDFKVKKLKEMISLSKKFMELPYIWGGTSSKGFDCSGFVQTLFKQTGTVLPRDSSVQSVSEKVDSVEKGKVILGDLLFFGKDKIGHVGIYLGKDKFIHSSARGNGKVIISKLSNECFFSASRVKKVEYKAKVFEIKGSLIDRVQILGNSQVSLSDLRYISLNHWNFFGYVCSGELVVHKAVVDDVIEIFKELFLKKFPIEKMVLMDKYDYKDELSCEDNNTSAFCSRAIVGENNWSYHAFGLAIDINPLLNPFCKKEVIIPKNGRLFLDRKINCRGMVNAFCYKTFIKKGWKWGGDWKKNRGYVDFQHFYKEL